MRTVIPAAILEFANARVRATAAVIGAMLTMVALTWTPGSVSAQCGPNGCVVPQRDQFGRFIWVNQFRAPAPAPAIPNYGIGPDAKFSKEESHTYNGQHISKAMAKFFIQGPGLPDDRNLCWLVTVSKTKDDKAKNAALFSGFATRFRIQHYLDGEWYTFDNSGSKVVYPLGVTVCQPGGKQCWHYDDPQSAFKELSLLPSIFDPLKLLDLLLALRNPPPAPTPQPTPWPIPWPTPGPSPTNPITIPTWAILGGFLLVFLIWGGRNK